MDQYSSTKHCADRCCRRAFLPLIFVWLLIFTAGAIHAQPFVKEATTAKRQQLYKNLVSSINRNLSTPLSDSTEENWIDAFGAMELLRYQSPWAANQVRMAFTQFDQRSADFQRALMELVYALFPGNFVAEVATALNTAANDKVFAMCAEYLWPSANAAQRKVLAEKVQSRFAADTSNAILFQLQQRLNGLPVTKPALSDLFAHRFRDSVTIVFSVQRSNRNFPGLAVVRDRKGNFIKAADGNPVNLPQLARSINNLPGYLSNGNTPQGIFRMKGIDTSRSIFIGPTPNLQLTMPFETSIAHFTKDSTIADSVWTEYCYSQLLPASWRRYLPIYGSYYAGKAGRTEIIAHGTTVSPDYYLGQPYYPLTPTLGCLCTKELWSGDDGRRVVSDQQLLIDAVLQAGGADGYLVVVELDDQQRPVTIEDILPFLPTIAR